MAVDMSALSNSDAFSEVLNSSNCEIIKDFNGFWMLIGENQSIDGFVPGESLFYKVALEKKSNNKNTDESLNDPSVFYCLSIFCRAGQSRMYYIVSIQICPYVLYSTMK